MNAELEADAALVDRLHDGWLDNAAGRRRRGACARLSLDERTAERLERVRVHGREPQEAVAVGTVQQLLFHARRLNELLLAVAGLGRGCCLRSVICHLRVLLARRVTYDELFIHLFPEELEHGLRAQLQLMLQRELLQLAQPNAYLELALLDGLQREVLGWRQAEGLELFLRRPVEVLHLLVLSLLQ